MSKATFKQFGDAVAASNNSSLSAPFIRAGFGTQQEPQSSDLSAMLKQISTMKLGSGTTSNGPSGAQQRIEAAPIAQRQAVGRGGNVTAV